MIGQLVSEIFMSESVNGRMDGRRPESHPVSSPRAFGSGKLTNMNLQICNFAITFNQIKIYFL